MNYFIYGEDTYRSRQKLRELVAACEEKAGGAIHIQRLDADECSGEVLQRAFAASSLFTPKKFIVIEYAFVQKDAREILMRQLPHTKGDKESVIVVWDHCDHSQAIKYIPTIVKLFDKMQEFKMLQSAELRRWIVQEAERRGLKVSPRGVAELAVLSGGPWQIVAELDKQLLAGSSVSGTAKGQTATIFGLGDTWFGTSHAALLTLCQLIDAGHEEGVVFQYLVGYIRTLLLVKSQLVKNQPIPASWRIHPYVAKKASAMVAGMALPTLIRALQEFYKEDALIKVGRATYRESLMRMALHHIGA